MPDDFDSSAAGELRRIDTCVARTFDNGGAGYAAIN